MSYLPPVLLPPTTLPPSSVRIPPLKSESLRKSTSTRSCCRSSSCSSAASRVYCEHRELLLLCGAALFTIAFMGSAAGLAIAAGVQTQPNAPGTDHKLGWSRGGLLAFGIACVAVHCVTMLVFTGAVAVDAGGHRRRTLPWLGAAFGGLVVAAVMLVVEELRAWGGGNWASVWLLVCAGWLVCMGLECATGFWYMVVHHLARCVRSRREYIRARRERCRAARRECCQR